MSDIKAQNILKLKTNEREKKEELTNSHTILDLNTKFFDFDFALFDMSLRAIKELLQNFSFELTLARTSR